MLSAPVDLKLNGELAVSSIPKSRFFVFGIIAVVGAAADLITKQWVFAWKGMPGAEPTWLIEPYVGIETSINIGALFGLGAGYGKVFAALSLVALIGILVWLFFFRAALSRWLNVAMACVTAGIIGNLYDRLGLWADSSVPIEYASGVRDWILFRYEQFTWPNFNLADSFLVVGACMLAWHSFFMPEPGQDSKADSQSRS